MRSFASSFSRFVLGAMLSILTGTHVVSSQAPAPTPAGAAAVNTNATPAGATQAIAIPPVAVPSPTPADALAAAAGIIHSGQGSLVIVEGNESSGSGFLCTLNAAKFLVTNAHVLAGNSRVGINLLSGSPVRVGGAGVAIGHDIVRLAVPAELPAFDVLDHVNETLLVGDAVVVLGNEKGARVITPLTGKVVGIGPNLVEVDAPFQPGNSGSPIIQVKTGKVVAIATYMRQERDTTAAAPPPATGDHPAAADPAVRVRRFGYRLDSVKGWQPMAWNEFQAEAALASKLDSRTSDLEAFLKDVNAHDGKISEGSHYEPAVQRPIEDFFAEIGHHPSPSDALSARQHLLDSLRRACQTDVADAKPRMHYDYFIRDLGETQDIRTSLAKAFTEGFNSQHNDTRR